MSDRRNFLNYSGDLADRAVRGELVHEGAGRGVLAGSLAAGVSHLAWGLNLPIYAFVYGYSMATLRSWPELAGILTMIGTTVLYSGMYEIITLASPGVAPTVGLIALAGVACSVLVVAASVLVDGMCSRALADPAAMAVDIERSQHWEERYFAALRARRAAGKSAAGPWARTLVLPVLAFAVALWSDNRFVEGLMWGLAFFQVIVSARMVQYLRRLNQRTGSEALLEAQRPPILFLRPFALDALPVSPIGDGWSSLSKVLSWVDKRTFEEHLSSTFEDLGPVIALGRPGEEAATLGAAREYLNEASWRPAVLAWAAMSQFVIMEVDRTPGMVWEIEHVTRVVGRERILIVLPPDDEVFATRSAEWYRNWAALQRRFDFLPDVSPDTAAVLYDDDDRPILVPREKSSVTKSLATVKHAWLDLKERRARAGGEAEDAEVAQTIVLGTVQFAEGSFRAARTLFAQAHRTVRGRHGDAHPLTLVVGAALADAVGIEGRWDEARELQQQLLDAAAKIYGDDHPEIPPRIGALAGTLRELGRLREAEALARQAYARARELRGVDDPQTLGIGRVLADSLADLDQGPAADALYAEVAERSQSALGPEHRLTLTTQSRRAQLLALDRPQEARPIQEQVLAARRRLLGRGHPDTAIAANNLANTLWKLGDEKGLDLQQEAYEGHRRAFGDGHPYTLAVKNNFAAMLAHGGQLERAIVLQEKVADESRRLAGPLHPQSLTALANLGRMARLADDLQRSRTLLEEARAGLERTLGREHRSTLEAGAALVLTLEAAGDVEKARTVAAELLPLADRALGPDADVCVQLRSILPADSA